MTEAPTVIGISGGSGSGKSWLARRIEAALPDQVTLIEQDWYYRDLSHLSHEEAAKTNFDHPSAIEHTLLIQHLKTLAEGRVAVAPGYSYVDFRRTKESKHLEPRPIIILEGLFVLYWPEIRNRLHLKLFIDTKPDVRFERRLLRDERDRGIPETQIRSDWNRHAVPMHRQFVEPTAQFADFVWESEEDTTFETRFLADLRKRLAYNGKNSQ